jgi:mutator protein MutT
MPIRGKKPHFHVTAGVIWKNGKVLIAKRPPGSHLEGLWEFPGGKQEMGESMRECLEREIREEVGLKVRAGESLLTVDHEYESRLISLHFFTCVPVSGEAKAIQCQQIEWVEPSDLQRFAFPPPDAMIIRSLSRLAPPSLAF